MSGSSEAKGTRGGKISACGDGDERKTAVSLNPLHDSLYSDMLIERNKKNEDS